MKMNLLKYLIVCLIVFSPLLGFALEGTQAPSITPKTDLTLDGVLAIFGRVLNFILIAVSIVAVGTLIYSGYLFMTGAGDEDALVKAKGYLKWGLVGLGIAILSFSGVSLLGSILAT